VSYWTFCRVAVDRLQRVPPNAMTLKGKTAFVTGATGGLGKAIASELASSGCNLFLTGRNIGQLRSVAAGLEASEISIDVCASDLTQTSDLRNLVGRAVDRFQVFDILINCAGVFPINPISSSTIEDFDNCFAVNVRAPFILCQSFLPAMAANGWGRVVNVGSSSAFSGFSNTSIYCASKHALLGLSRSLFQEMRAQNVRVISVNPGSIRTPMGQKSIDQSFETFLNPDDVARYVVFAISFDSELVSEEIRLNRLDIKTV